MQSNQDAPVLVQVYQNIVLVRIETDRLLEMKVINATHDAINKLIDMHPKISLVLDLAKVANMSSAMLGKLVALQKAVKKCKGRMAVCSVKPQIMELFKVTKLHKLFDIRPEAEAAINYYKRKPI